MMLNAPYRQCTISVMDTIADPDITFDENGISNYYYEYQEAASKLPSSKEAGRRQLEEIVDRIKAAGKDKPYDCIMGLSGGVDSSYMALLAKELGLRPLAVHFDNGWNTETANENISNIVRSLGLDLHTVRINHDEFIDLQRAYLKASVVDIEAITDHAIFASLYRLAGSRGIKYILSGTNIQTETTMPRTWNFSKRDHRNIKSIHKAFGQIQLKTFPFMDAKVKRYYIGIKKVNSVSLINYVPYNKEEIKTEIAAKLGWTNYGRKHGESIFTRFYQNYILPDKFGIDKRKAHLSDLIFAGQLAREKALEELREPLYTPELFEQDYRFVLEKLRFSENEFQDIMRLPRRSHYEFDYEMPIDQRYPALRPVKKMYRVLFRS